MKSSPHQKHLFALSLTMALASIGAHAQTAQAPLPSRAVAALDALSGGPHAGWRANHAKGVVLSGTFEPNWAGKLISRAPHFSRTTPVLVRFSNTSGLPDIADGARGASPHGMSIRFQLPDDEFTDIVAISANGFPVATPAEFVEMLEAAAQAKSGSPAAIQQFMATHPAAQRFASEPREAPVSFATLPFYGVNAFKFTNGNGEDRFGRYQIIPVDGAQYLSEAQATQAGPDYLMRGAATRVQERPIEFKLYVQIAAEGDKTDDATAVWPDSRKTIEMGTLRLTGVAPEQEKTQRELLFNPLALVKGIQASSDPILKFRPGVYGLSFSRRAN